MIALCQCPFIVVLVVLYRFVGGQQYMLASRRCLPVLSLPPVVFQSSVSFVGVSLMSPSSECHIHSTALKFAYQEAPLSTPLSPNC
jgi:hypothetical protein